MQWRALFICWIAPPQQTYNPATGVMEAWAYDRTKPFLDRALPKKLAPNPQSPPPAQPSPAHRSLASFPSCNIPAPSPVPFPPGGLCKALVPEQFTVKYVRGAEVIDVRDERENVFTGVGVLPTESLTSPLGLPERLGSTL